MPSKNIFLKKAGISPCFLLFSENNYIFSNTSKHFFHKTGEASTDITIRYNELLTNLEKFIKFFSNPKLQYNNTASFCLAQKSEFIYRNLNKSEILQVI